MRSFQGKNSNYLPSASFSLWREFKPPQDQLYFHCEMKRGYSRYRKKEEKVKALLERDTSAQFIGKLAQQVVWEFHQNLHLLTEENGINKIVELLDIEKQSEEIRERIYNVIRNYQQYPFLLGKSQLYIQEGIQRIKKEPNHLLIQWGQYEFNLYFEMDCHFWESENTVHILDFKTGNSLPDKRQAYVYLLAAQSLFPDYSAIAPFYNLENQKWTQPITASPELLECVLIELAYLSKKSTEERQNYRYNPEKFAEIFSPQSRQKL